MELANLHVLVNPFEIIENLKRIKIYFFGEFTRRPHTLLVYGNAHQPCGWYMGIFFLSALHDTKPAKETDVSSFLLLETAKRNIQDEKCSSKD